MQILLAWLIADFLSGLGHFAQDKLLTFDTKWKWLANIKVDNDLHHMRPGTITKYTYWQNLETSAPVVWALAFSLSVFGYNNVLTLSLYFLGFANLIHRWSHEHKATLHWSVRLMQKTGLFISGNHHNQHHFDKHGVVFKEDAKMQYCVMSCWLNPILNAIGFWRLLEILMRIK